MGKIEKRFILISIALISLLCIGAVSAADDIAADDVAAADSEDIGTIDAGITENDDVSLEVSDVAEDNPPTEVSLDDSLGISDEVSDDIAADESAEALGEDTPKTFTQLKDEISNPVDGVVTLSGTYKYDETADAALGNKGVVIQSNITINGPATIDGSNLSRIFYLYQSSATLNGLTFINGKGQQYGGAVLAYAYSPTIKNCIFKNNLVTDDEEQYYAYGGAIYFYSTTGATVNNCTFEDNLADFDTYGAGGAIYDYSDGLTIKDSTFTHNQATSSGAIEAYSTNMKIDGCLFDSNQAIYGQSGPYANGDAGAMWLQLVRDDDYNPMESNHKITKSIFINNQAGNTASTLRNEASGTNISDCIFLGPETLMGNSILSGCSSGTECENIWLGHTTENQSTYVSGGPDNWLVLDLNAVAQNGYYDVTASLNNLYTRSTGEVTPVETGISDIFFNVVATAGTCDETVKIQDGIGTIIYKLYKPEDGTLSVDYNGVTKSISLEGLEKPPEDVNLVINVDDIKKGETAKVEGQLTDLNGAGIVGIALTVVVNEVETIVNTVEDGKFSLDVPDLAVGQYAAFVNFAGNNDYNRAFNSTIFKVDVKDEDLILTASIINVNNITVGETAKVEGQLVNIQEDEGISGLTVSVVLTGGNIEGPIQLERNITTGEGGMFSFDVEGLDAGQYTAFMSFAGNDIYKPSSKIAVFNVNLKVTKLNVDVSVDGENIVIKVTDEGGNPVDGAKVNVNVDGAIQEYTTDKGTVTIPAGSGDHNMEISTEDGKTLMVKVVAGQSTPSGDDTPVSNKIKTAISTAHTTITTYNKAIDSKANAYFTVTLKDANGNVLANKAFKYIADGKVYNYVTDAKGQKKIYILSAAKKTVSAVILFVGDNQYAESFKAVKIKINPQKVKLVAKKKTFKVNKKVKKYTVTLKNSKGKAIKGKKLVLTINKKKYTAKTNKKGEATFKIKNLNKKGTYKAKVKFAGDKTYKKATKKAQIVIK